ncbi:Gfo/Idh/MocA family protein [Stutzerimonas stutzeri]|uniref:Oxidoreductase n=1 Tax=Stutzerimonas stutzeri TaxID=316 RepID=A0A0D9AG07_STUST|nr:Gfo/Idh/MocA family oxidoreductase [Stutzerimonas stutzeri]KJH79933.1 oxidoreductase [Stutzerimonas stutzeri]
MKQPLQIALVGAGIMGRQHIEIIARSAEAQLCAIADPDPQAQALAATHGVSWFADPAAMLEGARPDAVIIANPNPLHVDTAVQCLQRGVPVLVEKPVGTSLSQARRLVEVGEQTGVPVLVGHHRRHNPLIARTRQLLDEGALGRLTTVTALWQLQKPDSYFDIPWRREPGAGMLLTNLIHDLDLLRHLCGEVRQVQAFLDNGVRGFGNEDSAAAILRFESGAVGTLTASDAVAAPWSWELDSGENPVYPRQFDQPCYLLAGTRGAISLPQLQRWQYAQPGAGWHQPLLRHSEPVAAGDALTRQFDHFLAVVRGEAAPLIDAADAGRTLALVEAIERAAKTGTACEPEDF